MLLAPLLASQASRPSGAPLPPWTWRAQPQALRQTMECAKAVYVAWDRRGDCLYVGSVCRGHDTAIADRLDEHFRSISNGSRRRASWALLSVLPIRADAPLTTVRAAEGWAALLLSPQEGSAHPRVDLAAPPRALAKALR
ncbi:hypothetical protein [Streptomyces sp. NPDC088733]|uniref:hypothetical protein n=1 Tax=Streptomyces sp. NPDC088733 TaxID=3365880 RepID=UPI0037FCE5F2